jgi:hypothetical protein
MANRFAVVNPNRFGDVDPDPYCIVPLLRITPTDTNKWYVADANAMATSADTNRF